MFIQGWRVDPNDVGRLSVRSRFPNGADRLPLRECVPSEAAAAA